MNKPLIRSYLLLYNFSLTLGWVYVLYLAILSRNDFKAIWRNLEFPLKIVQTAAVFEIIHVVLGIVRSSIFPTFLQVFSRVILVWGVLNLSPPSQVSNGVPLLISAWTVTEIIRYSYYSLNSIRMASVTQWLRYTLFIVLYPIGCLGEIICIYNGMDYVDKHNIWALEMPNTLNLSFRYYYVMVTGICSYSVLLPALYIHMLGQRKRILCKGPSKAKTQ